MDTKECIEFLKQDDIGILKKHNNKIDEVIKRLQMWEEFKRDIENGRYCNILDYRDSEGDSLLLKLKDLEQKYFPKSVKKTITLTVEGSNKEDLDYAIKSIANKLHHNCWIKNIKEGD